MWNFDAHDIAAFLIGFALGMVLAVTWMALVL